jgi:type II secretory pathway pseudopilin PulG
MGLLGSMIGGALQGVGVGINNQVIAAREQALEAMRSQQQTALQDRQFAHQDATAATEHGYRTDESNLDYQHKGGLLALGAKADMAKDDHSTANDMKKITLTQVGQQELAKLSSRLEQGRTAAELKLRDDLSNGDFQGVVRGKDGQYYGQTKTGLVPTGVQFDPTAAEVGSNGGGMMDTQEQASAYNDALSAWRADGAKPESRPKQSDFVGVTRAQYGAHRAGNGAAPAAPGAVPPKAEPSAQTTARLTKALTDLAGIYASATPDKYPGLFRNGRKIPIEEARKTVTDAIGG